MTAPTYAAVTWTAPCDRCPNDSATWRAEYGKPGEVYACTCMWSIREQVSRWLARKAAA